MKKNVFFLFSFCCLNLIAQQRSLPMTATQTQKELAMSETNGNSSSGQYRYYAKGEKSPYTGILFAKYPNGNYETWQTYIDGIGQGVWINYYENGQYKEVGHYEQNRVEGPIKKYHLNGQLKASGTYKDWRIRIGEWSYYDENGRLIRTDDYGEKGNFKEVEAYYQRGEISYSWYQQILARKE